MHWSHRYCKNKNVLGNGLQNHLKEGNSSCHREANNLAPFQIPTVFEQRVPDSQASNRKHPTAVYTEMVAWLVIAAGEYRRCRQTTSETGEQWFIR